MKWFVARLGENSSRMAIGLFLGNIATLLQSSTPVNWQAVAAQALIALAVIITPEKKDAPNA